jgi:hypothetical protein
MIYHFKHRTIPSGTHGKGQTWYYPEYVVRGDTGGKLVGAIVLSSSGKTIGLYYEPERVQGWVRDVFEQAVRAHARIHFPRGHRFKLPPAWEASP